MKYNLIISPAIEVKDRHKIEDALKFLNYHIIGGGTHADGSRCDISFESKK